MSLAIFLNPIFGSEVLLTITAMLMTITLAIKKGISNRLYKWIAIFGVVVSLCQQAQLYGQHIVQTYSYFTTSPLIILMKLVMLTATGIYIFMLGRSKLKSPEHIMLILLSLVGMFVMISSNDFLIFYVGLEMQSMALYILVASRRDDMISNEAAMKYFILGAIASGFLLFGISLIYGYSGYIDFNHFINTYSEAKPEFLHNVVPAIVIGMVLILIGMCFKLSLAPFHMWTPEVYQGASAAITAYIATVAKAAVAVFLLRFVSEISCGFADSLKYIFIFVGLLSILVGSLAGIKQTDIKRMLAYSAIANMGFISLGMVGVTDGNMAHILNYIIIYLSINIGIFVIIALAESNLSYNNSIKQFTGFFTKNQFAAAVMAILMLSLAGIPPFAGFFAKFGIINSLVSDGYVSIAVVAVLLSVVACYYYLNIIKVMFFEEVKADEVMQIDISMSTKFIIFLLLLINIFYGLFWSGLNSYFVSGL